MTPALQKLRAELTAALDEKKECARKASDLRKQIAERERRDNDGLAYAIGRASLSNPSEPEVAALFRSLLAKLPPDRAAQLREVMADVGHDSTSA